jgi:hypothetical protein
MPFLFNGMETGGGHLPPSPFRDEPFTLPPINPPSPQQSPKSRTREDSHVQVQDDEYYNGGDYDENYCAHDNDQAFEAAIDEKFAAMKMPDAWESDVEHFLSAPPPNLKIIVKKTSAPTVEGMKVQRSELRKSDTDTRSANAAAKGRSARPASAGRSKAASRKPEPFDFGLLAQVSISRYSLCSQVYFRVCKQLY